MNHRICKFTLILIVLLMQADLSESQCSHPIFCNETILAAVADKKLVNDSKDFVDMVLKVPIDEALQTFKEKGV